MNAAAIELSGRAPQTMTILPILRMIGRSSAFVFFSLIALAEISIVSLFAAPNRRPAARAAWLHRWCQFACLILGIKRNVDGVIPRSGMMVSNHLSYLDIVVLSSVHPCVFVAKKDVATWPLFGWLARAAGTIFVDRNRKTASRDAADATQSAIDGGALVVLFPEATSSDGRDVLPFKSALVEPAVQTGCDLYVAAIDYSLSFGSVANEVCYWRDMTLVPHLLNLFSKRKIEAKLVIASATNSGRDRKELAHRLRRQIIEMRS